MVRKELEVKLGDRVLTVSREIGIIVPINENLMWPITVEFLVIDEIVKQRHYIKTGHINMDASPNMNDILGVIKEPRPKIVLTF